MPGHSYKGGSVTSGTALFPFSPVLDVLGANHLEWTYAGPGPDQWVVQQSNNGGLTWVFTAQVSSHIMFYDVGTLGIPYRVYGRLTDGTQNTGFSNPITP